MWLSALTIVLSLAGFAFFIYKSLSQDLGRGARAAFDGAANLGLLTGKISVEKVADAIVIRFPEGSPKNFPIGFYNWEYDYPGFDRAEVSAADARAILAQLVESHPVAESTPPVQKTHAQTFAEMDSTRPELEKILGWPRDKPVSDREDVFIDVGGVSYGLYAIKGQVHDGVIVFHLRNGKAVYVRTLQAPNGVFVYVPTKVGTLSGALHGIVRTPIPALEAAFVRATPSEIEILYPNLSAEQAVARAAREFGDIYNQVVRYIATTPEIIAAVGPIRDIRPAKGRNDAGAWLDYGAQFTFRVRGDNGSAAVLAEISDNNRTLKMIANGKMIDIEQRHFDWSGGKHK
jgi:hypothetical protein